MILEEIIEVINSITFPTQTDDFWIEYSDKSTEMTCSLGSVHNIYEYLRHNHRRRFESDNSYFASELKSLATEFFSKVLRVLEIDYTPKDDVYWLYTDQLDKDDSAVSDAVDIVLSGGNYDVKLAISIVERPDVWDINITMEMGPKTIYPIPTIRLGLSSDVSELVDKLYHLSPRYFLWACGYKES